LNEVPARITRTGIGAVDAYLVVRFVRGAVHPDPSSNVDEMAARYIDRPRGGVAIPDTGLHAGAGMRALRRGSGDPAVGGAWTSR
jgi:hypothetical protein